METNQAIKDSGRRQIFATGAVRDVAAGKGRFDLLPFEALEQLAKIFERGCQKYGDRNWEKGIPLSRYIDSGLRHAHKFASGRRDEPHLAMAAWNFCCCLATLERIEAGILPAELNDLPPTAGLATTAAAKAARKRRRRQTVRRNAENCSNCRRPENRINDCVVRNC